MSVLITGNKGFIGTNLTNLTGWDGFDKECDIRDQRQVYEALEGYDCVIHLAALAGVRRSIDKESDYVDTNINGTYHVALACWDMGIRLIFASSSSVYEAKSPYAKTKQGGEDIINSFVRHGLDACILRFFTVFGEYNRKDMAVYKFTQAIRKGEIIELYGNCKRDFTYVQDLCRAIEEVVSLGISGTHDLGFGDSIPVMSMIIMLENIIGEQAVVSQKNHRDFDAITTQANPSLMSSLTDRTPIYEALQQTLKTI